MADGKLTGGGSDLAGGIKSGSEEEDENEDEEMGLIGLVELGCQETWRHVA